MLRLKIASNQNYLQLFILHMQDTHLLKARSIVSSHDNTQTIARTIKLLLTYTCTLRQGLSVCAPTIVNPLPGVYLPPTANAMIVEKLLVKKYCEGWRERGRGREGGEGREEKAEGREEGGGGGRRGREEKAEGREEGRRGRGEGRRQKGGRRRQKGGRRRQKGGRRRQKGGRGGEGREGEVREGEGGRERERREKDRGEGGEREGGKRGYEEER